VSGTPAPKVFRRPSVNPCCIYPTPCNIAPFQTMPLALSHNIVPRFLPLRLPKVCLALAALRRRHVSTAGPWLRTAPLLSSAWTTEQPASALRRSALPRNPPVCNRNRHLSARREWWQLQNSMAAELEILSKAAAAGCQLLDLELEVGFAASPGHGSIAHPCGPDSLLPRFSRHSRPGKTLEKMLAVLPTITRSSPPPPRSPTTSR
jgi:hypothetical protein